MIRSFADPEAEHVWNRERSRKLPPDIQQRAMRRLTLLDAALSLDELGNLRGNRLHALKEGRASQHSISINDQWRICFVWMDGDAYDVEIADYH
ncbi:type II toxin-antitoxin system RelE/ParE family toxin [Sphingomonas sp. DC1600-2]|uniref:type II toxin-antitoxin system RelE/ParE family toxin n=1 Tax=unclassified Sphingomonas TaxID=196159 RepID=UPI003CF358B9